MRFAALICAAAAAGLCAASETEDHDATGAIDVDPSADVAPSPTYVVTKADGLFVYESPHTRAQSKLLALRAFQSGESKAYHENVNREYEECVRSIEPNADGGLTFGHQHCDIINACRDEGALRNVYTTVAGILITDLIRTGATDTPALQMGGSAFSPLFRSLLAFELRNAPDVSYTQGMHIIAARMMLRSCALSPSASTWDGNVGYLPGMTQEERDEALASARAADAQTVYDEAGVVDLMEAAVGSREVLEALASANKETHNSKGQMTPYGVADARSHIVQFFTLGGGSPLFLELFERSLSTKPETSIFVERYGDQMHILRDSILRFVLTYFSKIEGEYGDSVWRFMALRQATIADLVAVTVDFLAGHRLAVPEWGEVPSVNMAEINTQYPVVTKRMIGVFRDGLEAAKHLENLDLGIMRNIEKAKNAFKLKL